MGQGTVPCPILSMCRNVDFIQGAGKIIPRALVVGFNWAFHRGTENRPLSHMGQRTVPCPIRLVAFNSPDNTISLDACICQEKGGTENRPLSHTFFFALTVPRVHLVFKNTQYRPLCSHIYANMLSLSRESISLSKSF